MGANGGQEERKGHLEPCSTSKAAETRGKKGPGRVCSASSGRSSGSARTGMPRDGWARRRRPARPGTPSDGREGRARAGYSGSGTHGRVLFRVREDGAQHHGGGVGVVVVCWVQAKISLSAGSAALPPPSAAELQCHRGPRRCRCRRRSPDVAALAFACAPSSDSHRPPLVGPPRAGPGTFPGLREPRVSAAPSRRQRGHRGRRQAPARAPRGSRAAPPHAGPCRAGSACARAAPAPGLPGAGRARERRLLGTVGLPPAAPLTERARLEGTSVGHLVLPVRAGSS